MTARLEEVAPELTLPSHLGGELVNVHAFRGRSFVLVSFLPGWTARDQYLLQTIRDRWHELVDARVEVAVVFGQDVQVLQHRANEWSIPFPLLSDVSGAARRSWGVPRHWMVAPGRVSYTLDLRSQVRHVCPSWEGADEHVDTALEKVQEIMATLAALEGPTG